MSTRRRRHNEGCSDEGIMMAALILMFLPFWLVYELLRAIFE